MSVATPRLRRGHHIPLDALKVGDRIIHQTFGVRLPHFLQQFRCGQVGDRYGYRVRILPVGDDDPDVGAPTQLAVLTRNGGGAR